MSWLNFKSTTVVTQSNNFCKTCFSKLQVVSDQYRRKEKKFKINSSKGIVQSKCFTDFSTDTNTNLRHFFYLFLMIRI